MKVIIFVEGITDERLISQYCKKLQNEGLISTDLELEVKSVNGWTTIDSEKGASFRNLLIRNESGKNFLIFDADADPESRRQEILEWKTKYSIDFELFLFPTNREPGAVETLLERIINPSNQCIIECWHRYEDQLSLQSIPWKNPPTPTCPSEKSKIYGYLEALVGTTNSEKERIKDQHRDFTETNHWDLDAEGISALKEFLVTHLNY